MVVITSLMHTIENDLNTPEKILYKCIEKTRVFQRYREITFTRQKIISLCRFNPQV